MILSTFFSRRARRDSASCGRSEPVALALELSQADAATTSAARRAVRNMPRILNAGGAKSRCDLCYGWTMRGALVAFVLANAAACGGKSAPAGGGASTADWSGAGAKAAAEAFPPKAPYVVPGERMSYRLSMHGLEVATYK